MMQKSEWLNNPGPYTQYTHNPDPRLIKLIETYGFAFNDEFWYWIPKATRNGKKNQNLVKRAPLWTYPCKSVPAEKSRRHIAERHGKQKKIMELLVNV
jgi:hypothetical protein